MKVLPLKCLLMILLILALAACSSSPQSENQATYIGWHCDGEPGTKSWQCHQRPMRNGRVVGAIIVDKANANADKVVVSSSDGAVKKPKSDPVRSSVKMGDRRQLSWRERLPGLDGTEANKEANKENQDEVGVVVESRPAPTPQPEPAFEVWSDEIRPKTSPEGTLPKGITSDNISSVNAEEVSGNRVVSNSALVGSKNNYTVQLAAFDREELALEFVQRTQLQKVGVNVSPVSREGKQLFVVTYGEFASRSAAEAGWDALGVARELDVWVRPIP
ncbi:MAG: SPOR domain-containing protein [Porticoccaceae bacterium]